MLFCILFLNLFSGMAISVLVFIAEILATKIKAKKAIGSRTRAVKGKNKY